MSPLVFTGHRPNRFSFQYNEGAFLCRQIKQTIYSVIDCYCRKKTDRDIYVGGAIGTDMWAAEATIALKDKYPNLTLHCILPFEKHDKSWPQSEKNRLVAVCSHAKVEILSPNYSKQVYRERNEYLVNHSDFLVAVFDPHTGITESGTAQTVAYAARKGKQIIYISPTTGVIVSN